MSVIMNNGVPYMMVGGRLIQASILASLGSTPANPVSAPVSSCPVEISQQVSGSIPGSIPIPPKKGRVGIQARSRGSKKVDIGIDTDSDSEEDHTSDDAASHAPPRRIPTEAETNKILKALGDLSHKYARKKL